MKLDMRETDLANWLDSQAQIEAHLEEIFVRFALENRGILMSPRRAPEIVSKLWSIFVNFWQGDADETDMAVVAVQFAEQGMAFVTAAKLMQGLFNQYAMLTESAEIEVVLQFQHLFLEQFSNARELVQHRIQEKSQMALQFALQQQIEQQRLSNLAEAERNKNLTQILQLNNELASLSSKEILFKNAVSGICQALNLQDVTLFEWFASTKRWVLQTTSSTELPEMILEKFNLYLPSEGVQESDVGFVHQLGGRDEIWLINNWLRVGNTVRGGLFISAEADEFRKPGELAILIQTFSQNLEALWQNIDLLEETEQRAKDLEVLHGRFVDEIWRDEAVNFTAAIDAGTFQLKDTPTPEADETWLSFPLNVSDHTIGEIKVPATHSLSDKDDEILQALVNEFSDALNNAQLIQTTRSYANQLDVAVNVSKAANTILDRDQLISEVVEIVRDQFGFYYVGLFLVEKESNSAVLKAGTGTAGQIQLEKRHFQPIGEGSMIGAAVDDGVLRVAQDVSQAKDFSPNPLLPDTQSELALPLISRENVIGALTVQSKEKYAFSPTTLSVLQSMANQLAIAIENASLMAQTQTNLDESNRLYEAARTIGSAQNKETIFQILVDFAQDSNLADIILVVTEDAADPNLLTIPILKSNKQVVYEPEKRYPRRNYPLSENFINQDILYVRKNDPILLNDNKSQKLFAHYEIESGVFLTILSNNEWFGTIGLHCSETSVPTKHQLQPFLTLIDHATGILVNQRLLYQSESLYRIGRQINQALTQEDAIDVTVQEVSSYVRSNRAWFVLLDGERGTSKQYFSPNHTEQLSEEQPIIDNFVVENLTGDKKPFLIRASDAALPETVRERYFNDDGAVSIYFLPSANQQELLGYLAVAQHAKRRPFNDSNLIFLQTVMDHLTTQLENIKLLDEALSRAQELILLNQIQSNISQVIVIEQLAHTVYSQVGQLLDNTVFFFALYDATADLITPIYSVFKESKLDVDEIKLPDYQALSKFISKNLQHISTDQDTLTQEVADLLHIPVPKSALWMPLFQSDGRFSGFISVQSYKSQAYDENDSQLLRSIGTQTSLALTNAHQFETIQAKNEQLQQLDHLKTQFLANMSHELRTPLNSIIGFSRVILKGIDGPITPEQEEDLSSIYSNGQHLLLLINEILDMAKIGAGKMNLSFEQVDVVQSAKIASTTIQALLDKEKVKFIWDVPADLTQITADPIRIRQIFINLLSNAVKYTAEGHIRLSIRQEDNSTIHIMVSDTGIGIAREDFDKVFTAFEQVDNTTTRSFGGTGLGLPITKWIVEMHQGEIWFDTKYKKGTTFHVRLPIHKNES